MSSHIIRGRHLSEPRTPITLPARPAWMFHPDRPCKDNPLWTSNDKHELNEAAKLCRKLACPVLQQCGRWAVDNGEKDLVWGGLNFSTAEMRAVVEEAAGRVPGVRGRKSSLTLEQQVRELWADKLSDSTIALRVGKTPTDISKLRKKLGLAALYGPGGRPLEGAAA